MKFNTIISLALFAIAGAATAAPITITGYDIESTFVSGEGGWAHYYNGTITSTGTINNGTVANYTGGSGTLNDGVIGTSHNQTQLFNYPGTSSPIITLYLDGLYSIDSLLIYGGNFLANSIPGEITALDITIGSTTQHFNTIGQGMSSGGRYADDYVDLTGTTLAGLVTDQVILSGFDSSWGGYDTFSITEISLTGTEGMAVPEPAILALLGFGLVGFGLKRRRR